MHTVKKTVILLFVAMLANVAAHAQEASVSVDVPFDFVVGQQTLGAGAYHLQRQGEFLLIRSAEGRSAYVLLLAGGTASKQDGNPYIVFRRFGTEAFLESVVFSNDRNYDLPQSSRERELMSKLNSGEEVAVQMQ